MSESEVRAQLGRLQVRLCSAPRPVWREAAFTSPHCPRVAGERGNSASRSAASDGSPGEGAHCCQARLPACCLCDHLGR